MIDVGCVANLNQCNAAVCANFVCLFKCTCSSKCIGRTGRRVSTHSKEHIISHFERCYSGAQLQNIYEIQATIPTNENVSTRLLDQKAKHCKGSQKLCWSNLDLCVQSDLVTKSRLSWSQKSLLLIVYVTIPHWISITSAFTWMLLSPAEQSSIMVYKCILCQHNAIDTNYLCVIILQ